MKQENFLTLGFVASLWACGTTDDAVSSTTEFVPYVGEQGELVCSRNETIVDGQQSAVEREIYHPRVMNEALAGRGALDAETIAFMARAGLTNVATCDDARQFITLQRESVESRLPPEAFAPPGLDAEAAAASGVTTPIDKVADGLTSAERAVVRLVSVNCSGFLIHPKVLITAGHCFGVSGGFSLKVDQGRGPTGAPNFSAGCLTCKPGTPASNVVVHLHPNFAGFGDTAHDVAIVISRVPWEHSDPVEPGEHDIGFMPLNATPSPGETYLVDGYGAHASTGSGAGIHRRARILQGFDVSAPGYYRDEVQQGVGRPCRRDSGSPAINLSRLGGAFGGHLASGVFGKYEAEPLPNDWCGGPGDYFWYSKVDDKITWIRDTLDNARLGRCTLHSNSSGQFLVCG